MKPDKPTRIPVAVLREARLNLEDVPIQREAVVFEPAADFVDLEALVERLDFPPDFWARFRDLRRESGSHAFPGPSQKDREYFENLFEQYAEEGGVAREELIALIRDLSTPNVIEADLQRRTEEAYAVMRKTAVVRHGDTTYLLSTHDPGNPAIVAQVKSADEVIEEVLWVIEFIVELLFGLATLLGAKLKAGVKMGGIVERIAEAAKKSKRLRKALENLATKGQRLSAWDLLTIIVIIFEEGFTWECLKATLPELLDMSFWAILGLLFKWSSRLTPGMGQALLAADLLILLNDLRHKL